MIFNDNYILCKLQFVFETTGCARSGHTHPRRADFGVLTLLPDVACGWASDLWVGGALKLPLLTLDPTDWRKGQYCFIGCKNVLLLKFEYPLFGKPYTVRASRYDAVLFCTINPCVLRGGSDIYRALESEYAGSTVVTAATGYSYFDELIVW